MSNSICHIELAVADLAAASAFYGDVFGWRTIPIGGRDALWDAGDGPGGGFSLDDPSAGGGQRTVAFVKVEDIEVTLAKIGELGGAMVKPKTKISDEFGFYALFKDPGGTVLGLWSQS
ncbi:VOC family protein [bacterium]|nr:VOC family protein [bacterium]